MGPELKAVSLVIAIALAGMLGLATASTALAECTWGAPLASKPFLARYAFRAAVVDVPRDVDPAPRNEPPFTWQVELRIDRVYRGSMPERLVLKGQDVDCSMLMGERLREGDQLFVALTDHHSDWHGLFGELLLWHRVGNGWDFYDEVLHYGQDPRFYPAEARSATTTEAILDVVEAIAVPDTGTIEGATGDLGQAKVAVLCAAFLIGLALGFRRLTQSGDIPAR